MNGEYPTVEEQERLEQARSVPRYSELLHRVERELAGIRSDIQAIIGVPEAGDLQAKIRELTLENMTLGNEVCSIIAPAEVGGGIVQHLTGRMNDALAALETIRTERLVASGLPDEATAVSKARVLLRKNHNQRPT